jgi:hypothetical protein
MRMAASTVTFFSRANVFVGGYPDIETATRATGSRS